MVLFVWSATHLNNRCSTCVGCRFSLYVVPTDVPKIQNSGLNHPSTWTWYLQQNFKTYYHDIFDTFDIFSPKCVRFWPQTAGDSRDVGRRLNYPDDGLVPGMTPVSVVELAGMSRRTWPRLGIDHCRDCRDASSVMAHDSTPSSLPRLSRLPGR